MSSSPSDQISGCRCSPCRGERQGRGRATWLPGLGAEAAHAVGCSEPEPPRAKSPGFFLWGPWGMASVWLQACLCHWGAGFHPWGAGFRILKPLKPPAGKVTWTPGP